METNTKPPENAREILRWEDTRNPAHVRSARWYLMGGVFVLSCAVYGIVTGQWSFTVVMILLAGMYVLTRNTADIKLSIAITQEGVVYQNEFTGWRDCVDFWLLQGHDYVELHIARRKWSSSEIIIQTANLNPQMIRSALGQYLPERSGQTERLLDTIIRICKL